MQFCSHQYLAAPFVLVKALQRDAEKGALKLKAKASKNLEKKHSEEKRQADEARRQD